MNTPFKVSSLKELETAMKNCEQMKGLSVYDHGVMVMRYFTDLLEHIEHEQSLKYQWKLPEWIHDEVIWNNLLQINDIIEYQIYHDCGKPFCLQIDDQGRKHFPDHANVSANIWKEVMGETVSEKLIRQDMDIHLLKNSGVEEFASRPEAITLLLTGLAEVHANAEMFGGIDSTSFKIKWKQINKRGKAIINSIKKREIL